MSNAQPTTKVEAMKTKNQPAKRMTCEQFTEWMIFWRNAEVTIGSGEKVWTMRTGCFRHSENGGFVQLTRYIHHKNGWRQRVTTTVAAERVRLVTS